MPQIGLQHSVGKQSAPKQSDSDSEQRSRSREKRRGVSQQHDHIYLRKFVADSEKPQEPRQHQFGNFESTVVDYRNESDQYKQVVRSLLRIEQGREDHFDKFAKVVWIYKDRMRYDHSLSGIMMESTRYLQQLTVQELQTMLLQSEEHRKYEEQKSTQFAEYWVCLIGLLTALVSRANSQQSEVKEQYQYKVSEIIDKKLPELLKLQKQTNSILKSQSCGPNTQYWEYVLDEIKFKKMQLKILQFYEDYRNTHQEIIDQSLKEKQQQTYEEPTSPILLPFSSVNYKLIVNAAEEDEARKKLAERIFKEEFEKGQERLQRNLSITHNHGLLTGEIVTESAGTFDQITKEIIEFEKYKRMEEDQEEFNDWVPCETEGRFRNQKPYYLNRVRVACEWNKYNTTHYNEQNPPPKTVQGYKFNIFYPDLYDKQKTPQYYLENTDDQNYCLIKFKAGPPYKDIAFKILKKQWDFTQKSGFESIFSKGILQLYFNFKKPKYRI